MEILFYKNSINKLNKTGIYIIEDIDLHFIDKLYDEINEYNVTNNIDFNIVKIYIIPYPHTFTHPSDAISRMNNLIILQKL